MNILVRADSSSTIGTGHIMRDLVLVQQYKDAHIIFATQALLGNINQKILEYGYEHITLQSNTAEELCRIIKSQAIDMLVIDHYSIGASFEQFIKENTSVKILSLDDTYQKHHCDILLNHNVYAENCQYKDLVPINCELRCGKEHTLLRQEFYIEREKGRQNKNKKFTLFIAIGGTDHTNINPKILAILEKWDNLLIQVITTTANKHLAELKIITENKTNLQLHINSTKIAQLMNNANLAIISPSVTMNEILFLEIPFIAIKTAENQKYMANYLEEHKLTILDSFNSNNFKKELSQKIPS